MWEVQGHGTVTGAGDPRDGAARREILPPWVDIRLTFADGARLDVLAVVRDGRIAIEDAQADPPLALDGFAALAEAIEAPLHNACQVVAGPHRPPVPQPAESGVPADTPVTSLAAGSGEGAPPLPEGPVSPAEAEAESEAGSQPAHASGPALLATEGPGEQPATVRPAEEPTPERAPEAVPAAPPEPEPAVAQADAQPAAQSAAPGAAPEAAQEQDRSGRHRARPSLPRGSAARQGVAEIYRAAQQAGQDPVLAVMSATGYSRRKALRLIAGARDDGHLTPRHHRR
ncbi:DUF6214 family protein [Streptomyces scopuliridis]|uniref:DUF6214 family protein n=1 Tax=Streptomyces scopuliridis TaxID=452529 RepID=UPI0035D7D784